MSVQHRLPDVVFSYVYVICLQFPRVKPYTGLRFERSAYSQRSVWLKSLVSIVHLDLGRGSVLVKRAVGIEQMGMRNRG